MMLGGWGLLIVLLGVAWGLQMFLAYRQARAFMAQVRRLRGLGRTAIGVSSQNRFARRVYAAIAVDDAGRVREAIRMSGLTVWARPRAVDELRERTIDDLVTRDDSALALAAAMAARSLRGAADGGDAAEVEGAPREEVEHSR